MTGLIWVVLSLMPGHNFVVKTDEFFVLRQECAARGEDYERVKLLEISAEEAERWERKKKKKNPDLGFSGNVHDKHLCISAAESGNKTLCLNTDFFTPKITRPLSCASTSG